MRNEVAARRGYSSWFQRGAWGCLAAYGAEDVARLPLPEPKKTFKQPTDATRQQQHRSNSNKQIDCGPIRLTATTQPASKQASKTVGRNKGTPSAVQLAFKRVGVVLAGWSIAKKSRCSVVAAGVVLGDAESTPTVSLYRFIVRSPVRSGGWGVCSVLATFVPHNDREYGISCASQTERKNTYGKLGRFLFLVPAGPSSLVARRGGRGADMARRKA